MEDQQAIERLRKKTNNQKTGFRRTNRITYQRGPAEHGLPSFTIHAISIDDRIKTPFIVHRSSSYGHHHTAKTAESQMHGTVFEKQSNRFRCWRGANQKPFRGSILKQQRPRPGMGCRRFHCNRTNDRNGRRRCGSEFPADFLFPFVLFRAAAVNSSTSFKPVGDAIKGCNSGQTKKFALSSFSAARKRTARAPTRGLARGHDPQPDGVLPEESVRGMTRSTA
jgi:hypothetical protein